MTGMSGPPLTGRLPAQAAGSFVTGSSLPQALVQRRQRLTNELRLCKLVILSWSAPQPAAGDSAVAQPTTAVFTCLACASELTGDMSSRHSTPQPVRLIASAQKRRVPSRVNLRAPSAGTDLFEGTGSPLALKTGSEFLLGIMWPGS